MWAQRLCHLKSESTEGELYPRAAAAAISGESDLLHVKSQVEITQISEYLTIWQHIHLL